MNSAALLRPPPLNCPGRQATVVRNESFIAQLWERCEQRKLIVEMNRTRVLLQEERRRLRDEAIESERAARADEEWLRSEAAKMAVAGWTREELREIGFPERFLPPRSANAGGGGSGSAR